MNKVPKLCCVKRGGAAGPPRDAGAAARLRFGTLFAAAILVTVSCVTDQGTTLSGDRSIPERHPTQEQLDADVAAMVEGITNEHGKKILVRLLRRKELEHD